MPKLWDETIEAHRAAVRDAVLTTTSRLVADHGLLSVTMSQIAEQTGIGRATLYKYFPDVEAILLAWHERQIHGHLEHLCAVRDRSDDARGRLESVLEAYAHIDQRRGSGPHHGHLGDPTLVALLHGGGHVARAKDALEAIVRDLIDDAVQAGAVRNDVPSDELASYCLHALQPTSGTRSKAAVRRLVEVTLSGLKPR